MSTKLKPLDFGNVETTAFCVNGVVVARPIKDTHKDKLASNDCYAIYKGDLKAIADHYNGLVEALAKLADKDLTFFEGVALQGMGMEDVLAARSVLRKAWGK